MAKYDKAALIAQIQTARLRAEAAFERERDRERRQFDIWKRNAVEAYAARVEATGYGDVWRLWDRDGRAGPPKVHTGLFSGAKWEAAIAELNLMEGDEVEINSRTSTHFLTLATGG